MQYRKRLLLAAIFGMFLIGASNMLFAKSKSPDRLVIYRQCGDLLMVMGTIKKHRLLVRFFRSSDGYLKTIDFNQDHPGFSQIEPIFKAVLPDMKNIKRSCTKAQVKCVVIDLFPVYTFKCPLST